jgi:predicted amino acid racemase
MNENTQCQVEPQTHEIKSWVERFEEISSGRVFDIRNNDRHYHVGDVVIFREHDPNKNDYTGRTITATIEFLHTGALPGLHTPGNLCVFQFKVNESC